MKTLTHSLIIKAILSGSLLSSPAFAAKMSGDTQDLVISKMERVLSGMNRKDSSWIASQQRLADLLSERARTRFMSEVEANCDGCKGSAQDRKKAISIYEDLLKDVDLNAHGPILFQLAHLYEGSGQNSKAQNLYESILKDAKKKKINKLIVAKSRIGLADLLFQKNKFKEARGLYILALKEKDLKNKSLVIYNKAWAEFNQGQLATAIATMEGLVAKPEQITRDSEESSVYDPVFHADLMRDLSTFYSRREITARDIDKFEKFSPAQSRKELLLHFADEVDRIGQKKAANLILNKYLQTADLNKEERLQALVKLAQINYDRGQNTQSIQDFAKAAAAYQENGCKEADKCVELQKTMKRYVTELHRSKKVKPDQDLLNAYQVYAKTFQTDAEMLQRGAQVAVELNQHIAAIEFYRAISSQKVFSDKEREDALLNEVATAEKSNNQQLQRAAYLYFLDKSENEAKKFEIRYQLAYLQYQQKQLAPAADAFHDLAQDKKGKADLRKKSADLSLDCLAQLKNDRAIESWATEYAAIFPAHKNEFSHISRKALMNRAALTANSSQSSSSDLKSVLKDVLSTNLATASAEEKVLFFSNASVLAQKTGEEETFVKTQLALLDMSGVSAAKKTEILEQLVGHYEKKLDFTNAYKYALRLQKPRVSTIEREFRLGTLADLAGIKAQTHYQKSLKAGLKGSRELVLRTRLVLLAGNPVAELKKQTPYLKRDPRLLNDTALFVYARTGNRTALTQLKNVKELQKQPASRFIKNQELQSRILAFTHKMASQKLNNASPRQLQKSTGSRVKMLAAADGFLSESLKLKDISAQMLSLQVIAQENERLVKDLAALPPPQGLSESEMKQYANLFKAKLKPFLYKAKAAQQQQQNLWDSSPALAQLARDYRTARPEIQKILSREMDLLSNMPGSGKMKSEIGRALSASDLSPSDLAKARRSVAENPSSIKDIENLKMIETKIGHPLMPSYLEARLNHLQKGKRL